jgi:hypothetical protein
MLSQEIKTDPVSARLLIPSAKMDTEPDMLPAMILDNARQALTARPTKDARKLLRARSF